MTLLTTDGSHQNPLIRRARRHSALAMLFRTMLPGVLPGATPAPRAQAPLILGQPQQTISGAEPLPLPMANAPEAPTVETFLSQPAPMRDLVDLPNFTPALGDWREAAAPPASATALQGVIPASLAAVAPTTTSAPSAVQRTIASSPSAPARLPTPATAVAPIAQVAPPVMAVPVAKAADAPVSSPLPTNPGASAARPSPSQPVSPATQTVPLPAPTVATPPPAPLQRAAVEPVTDIDASTWRRLQAAYNLYREREATGGWPPRAERTSGAATAQPPFATRRPAPIPPTPPAPARPAAGQRDPEPALAVQQPPPLSPPAAPVPYRESSATIAQPIAAATTAGQTAAQPAQLQRAPTGEPMAQPPLTADRSPVQSELVPTPFVLPSAASLPVAAEMTAAQRAPLSTSVPPAPSGATVAQPPPALSPQRSDPQPAPVMSAAPMLNDLAADDEALTATHFFDMPSLEAVWPVHEVADAQPGAPGALPGMVQRLPDVPASLPPLPDDVADVAPLAPQVQERLNATQTARPTESKVDVVMPRRPRPPLPGAVQPTATPTVAQRTAAPTHQPAPPQPAPSVPAAQSAGIATSPDILMVATEIGPLPADLWTLVGVAPPQPVIEQRPSPVVARAPMTALPTDLAPVTVAAPASLPSIAGAPDGSSAMPTVTPSPTLGEEAERATPASVTTGQAAPVASSVSSGERQGSPVAGTIQRAAAVPAVEKAAIGAETPTVLVDRSDAPSFLPLPVTQEVRPQATANGQPTPTNQPTALSQPSMAVNNALSFPTPQPMHPTMSLQRQPEPMAPPPVPEVAAAPPAGADEETAKKKRRKPSTPTKSPVRSTRRSAAN